MARENELRKLEKEQAAFDELLPEMLKDHAGEFVVFHHREPVIFFENYEEAYQWALDTFGPEETFLISEVKKRDHTIPSISWVSGVMFGDCR